MLDLKYVRHSPRLYQHSGLADRDDVKSDGSLKVKLGRLSVVLLYKLAVDLQHFVEPLMRPGLLPQWLALAGRVAERAVGRLRTWPTRLHVSLDLHLPALLLPQKSASPNLIVANLGRHSSRHALGTASRASLPAFLVERSRREGCTSCSTSPFTAGQAVRIRPSERGCTAALHRATA